MSCGFDAGTYNLVCARRNENKDFKYNHEVNAFLEFPCENKFVFNLMKKSEKVPLILREDQQVAYALGEAAMQLAYTMSHIDLKRPMKDGCVNPKEKDAFEIMNIMMHSLLEGDDGEGVQHDKEIMYYSVPANAINEQTDADYHQKILEAIFKAYKSKKHGWSVDARPINEGMALIYAEMADKQFTGIGVSCGAGMVNVAFSMYGAEVFTFSLVNSGDWIDHQAAHACQEPIPVINHEKTKIDLNKDPQTLIERAIQTQYQLMIEKTVGGIKKGLEENKEKRARLDHPIDVVVAGGTSSPPGFDTMFEKLIKSANMPIEIGKVIRPADPVFSVARGCLIAAENAMG